MTWSDGGAATHSISTPLANTTYTATYQAVSAVFTAKIDFQTPDSQGFSGYMADTGLVFGNRANGFSYGWNGDNTAATRNRDSALSPDERYDTLIHMQKPSLPNARWEIAVPSGTYNVRVVAGDPSHIDSIYRINVEGVLTINGRPTSSQRWLDNTVQVTVNDGRLTVRNASRARNNKLAFLEITRVTTDANSEPPFDALASVEAAAAPTPEAMRNRDQRSTGDRDGRHSSFFANLGESRADRRERLGKHPTAMAGQKHDQDTAVDRVADRDNFEAAIDTYFASLDAE